MAINIDTNTDGDVTYQNPPVNRVLFPNITDHATPEEIQAAVDAWLEDHPEATTTVQDGSILPVKLNSSNDAADGYVLSYNATAGKFEWINVQADINDLKQDYNQLTTNKNPSYNNIIDWKNINNESLMWNAGTYQSNNGYWNTGYVPVEPETTYVVWRWTDNVNVSIPRILYFKADKTSISAENLNDSQFTTPANCKYVVMNFRYVHNGTLGTYDAREGWDDNINYLIANVGTKTNKTMPYEYYLSDDIHVKHNVTVSGKVISISDAVKGDASIIVNRSAFGGGTSVAFVICGRNIFDGVTQAGYWSGSMLMPSETHKCSVNPTYVNGGEYIVTNKSCRITEFDANDTYVASAIATARLPYLISTNTAYIHIASENDNMDAMCVYMGTDIPSVDEAYSANQVTETIRDYGLTSYSIPITLNEGHNTIFAKLADSPSFSVVYNKSISVGNQKINKQNKEIQSILDDNGLRLAQSRLFVAHRGSTVQAPENTTYSIVRAFQNGYKAVELDVRFTSDDIPVLLHDSTIDRTSNGTGAVDEMTYATLQTYDFGSWFSNDFTGAKCPSFEIALRLCRALNLDVHIDLGGLGTGLTESRFEILSGLVFKYGYGERSYWYLASTALANLNKIDTVYSAKNQKATVFVQCATYPEETILNLLDSIHGWNYTNLKIGISVNISAITSDIKTKALGYDIPVVPYFIDSLADYTFVQDYPYEFYCTNRLDLPYYACTYFAPGSIWK